ncbi:zinc finger protein 142-like [Hyalella azteca]|uniref:Zinc finger protein 142-like n=1 Tax=Hyalella azteca TaxID=294128 RepID=A0A979FUB5_HYAAZ|nr:zinc finger protein 142-like [Hyalella azteca]
MDIIMDDMKECRVVMHKLSNDAVEKGWWSGLNRLLRPSGVGKIKSDATAASGSSLHPKVVAVNIKLEPLYEEDDISVKDEPIDIDENQQTPPSSSSVPCKKEAQVEARDAHQCASQDAAAMPKEQDSSGEPPSPGCGGQLAPPSPSATDASGSSIHPKVVAVNIKLEPLYEEADISVKDEPIDIDENQQTPPSSSCVPCKEEAQVEAQDAHQCASQDAAAMPEEQASSGEPPSPECGGQLAPPPPSGGPDELETQIEARDANVAHRSASLSSAMPGLVNVGRRQSAPAGHPEDAGGSSGVSEASSSQQRSERHPYSQRGFVDAKITCQMQQRHLDEQASLHLYSCSDCEYSCGSELQLLKHISAKHSREKTHHCSGPECVCFMERNPANDIVYKLLSKKPHHCKKCEYSCVTKRNLKRHVLHKHSSKKPLDCSECEYSCVTKSQLKNHILQKHTYE